MGGKVVKLLRLPIELANLVREVLLDGSSSSSSSFKRECAELLIKVENLADLLSTLARLFARDRNPYEPPAHRIAIQASKTLDKSYTLVKKCKRSGIWMGLMNIISTADFRRANTSLEAAIGDVTWLLNVCTTYGKEGRRGGGGEGGGGGGGMEGLPPIASVDPMLAWVWEQIALVHGGSSVEKEDGASYLASLAADSDRNRNLIIEEGGVAPLLRLLKEGSTVKGRLAAVTALGTLVTDRGKVQQLHEQGVVNVLVNILQEGYMKLQCKVAWMVAKMASQVPNEQNYFFDENLIRPLVSLLVFETMDRNTHKTLRTSNTMHSVVRSGVALTGSSVMEGKLGKSEMKTMKSLNGRPVQDSWDTYSAYSQFYFDGKWDGLCRSPEHIFTQETKTKKIRHLRGFSDSFSFHVPSNLELLKRVRESEDPETKRDLKFQVTSALCNLAKDNVEISRKITETKALICLAQMIEKEVGEVQKIAILAVMEIGSAAERDAELRRFAFKMNSRAAKAVLHQLLRIIENGSDDLKVPCVKTIGCLARTFPAKETKVIEILVHELGNSEYSVALEASVSLQKFVHRSNFLHVEHSKTILDAGSIHRLMHLISLDGKEVQLPSLTLLCYLAEHLPSHDVFMEMETLKALKAVSHTHVAQLQSAREDLIMAIQQLELYQSGGH